MNLIEFEHRLFFKLPSPNSLTQVVNQPLNLFPNLLAHICCLLPRVCGVLQCLASKGEFTSSTLPSAFLCLENCVWPRHFQYYNTNPTDPVILGQLTPLGWRIRRTSCSILQYFWAQKASNFWDTPLIRRQRQHWWWPRWQSVDIQHWSHPSMIKYQPRGPGAQNPGLVSNRFLLDMLPQVRKKNSSIFRWLGVSQL